MSDAVGMDVVTRTEVDMQVATAKAYPRSVSNALMAAKKLITMTQGTAEDCLYALPRAGKSIEGPSVRFAEILAACYQNLRVATRIVSDGDERFIVAQGACMDVENNVTRTVEVRRRITYSNGSRYNDDMVMTTANAAASIAARNVVLASIPKAVWEPLYELARRFAVGEGETFVNTRARVLGYLQKQGADLPRVLAFLNVTVVEAITPDMVVLLRGVASAIKEGDVSVDDALPVATTTTTATPAGSSMKDRLGVKDAVAPTPEVTTTASVAPETKGPVVTPDAKPTQVDTEYVPPPARGMCSFDNCMTERAADSLYCDEHKKSGNRRK